jgi:hypothetical protein
MKFKTYVLIIFQITLLCLASQKVISSTIKLDIDGIYTTPPKQLIKEFTASYYIFLANNDFDRDGVMETIVGANCVEEFCENYIFKHLTNDRYQYLGKASFPHESYELVWKNKEAFIYPDIIFFKSENVGQGCLGRYHYTAKVGYQLNNEICRLPIAVGKLVNTNAKEIDVNKKIEPKVKIKDPDFIDFSNIKYDDKPEDFFIDKK